jgi:hypothetical protein
VNRGPGEPEVSRWRVAAPFLPLLVLATGVLAVLYPAYSPALLGALGACVGVLLAGALVLALGRGWRGARARATYSAVVLGSFAAFGVALAWRALGGGAGLGAAFAVAFAATIAAGVAFHRPLTAVFGWRGAGGGTATAVGASGITLGLVVFLAIRLAPVWFAQHLLLPAMLLVTLIVAAGLGERTFR